MGGGRLAECAGESHLVGVAEELVAQDQDEVFFEKTEELARREILAGIASSELGTEASGDRGEIPSGHGGLSQDEFRQKLTFLIGFYRIAFARPAS
jgi:hypothetical protein